MAVSRDPGDTGTLCVRLEDVSITGNAAVLHGGGLALVGGDAANGLMFMAFSGLVRGSPAIRAADVVGGVCSDAATIGLAASGETDS